MRVLMAIVVVAVAAATVGLVADFEIVVAEDPYSIDLVVDHD